jgi:hypothetical protein
VVAVGIVESFETVDIEHRQAQRRLASGGPGQLPPEGFLQIVAVEQTRQGVPDCLRAQGRAQLQIGQREFNHLAQGGQQLALLRPQSFAGSAAQAQKALQISPNR